MTDFSQKVPLGRTGIMVSRLGIGSAYGVSQKACSLAFDKGVNYFFWGSVRMPGMALAIRDIAAHHREELVVVLECYARHPSLIRRSVIRGLRNLRLEQADVLLLGWHETRPGPRVLETVAAMKEQGLFRFLGISSHQRPLFQSLLSQDLYDVFHIRYNAAHRGAEQDIFPFLPEKDGPGVVSFTNTRWGDLLKEKCMPEGMSPPSARDCYRFSLSNPHVHVAICGPKNDEEMKTALTVLNSGPLGDSERETMQVTGDHVHETSSFMSIMN